MLLFEFMNAIQTVEVELKLFIIGTSRLLIYYWLLKYTRPFPSLLLLHTTIAAVILDCNVILFFFFI